MYIQIQRQIQIYKKCKKKGVFTSLMRSINLHTNTIKKKYKKYKKKMCLPHFTYKYKYNKRKIEKESCVYLINEVNQFRLCWVLPEGTHHTLVL